MKEEAVLRLGGEFERPIDLTFEDLSRFPPEDQVFDVSRLDARRQGRGVRLEALLRHACLRPTARYLTVRATRDGFAASVPVDAVAKHAVIVYAQDERPLTPEQGGPFRLLIPDAAACRTREIDECANVKFVDHIEARSEPGPDTRPQTPAEHAALHERTAHDTNAETGNR
ncbi:MAG: hypothetical protein D6725_15710 [Planctomycetota bacterium]|nr:MAG: hypothetical protein D6725_15710 [Planctomycetota bacterium]